MRRKNWVLWSLFTACKGERSTKKGKYAKNEGGQRIKGRWLASRRRIGLSGTAQGSALSEKPSFHSHCLPRPTQPSFFEIMLGSFRESLGCFLLPCILVRILFLFVWCHVLISLHRGGFQFETGKDNNDSTFFSLIDNVLSLFLSRFCESTPRCL